MNAKGQRAKSEEQRAKSKETEIGGWRSEISSQKTSLLGSISPSRLRLRFFELQAERNCGCKATDFYLLLFPFATKNVLKISSKSELRNSRFKIALASHYRYGAVLLVVVLLAGFAHVPILREIASVLIVEDPLQKAGAIVALGGQTPFREIEAAELYREGWAPSVIIVADAPSAESEALQRLRIRKQQSWELSRDVLIQQGVPPAAIVIPKDEAVGTLEELQAVYKTLAGQRPGDDVRREGLGKAASAKREEQSVTVFGHLSVVAPNGAINAERDNASNATNAMDAEPNDVILVTSKYHTRRTRLIWHYVSGGRSQAIVRAAAGDPFDPSRWWQKRRDALSVAREYLGLANYYAGFPVKP